MACRTKALYCCAVPLLCACLFFQGRAQSFNYKLFTPADGLPDGSTGYLFQDSYGYLWIASCGGLTRYDGKTFRNFGLKDGLPFLCNAVLLEDGGHNVWGVSNGYRAAQVIKFSGGRFIAFPFEAKDSISYVFSLFLSEAKNICAATDNGAFEQQNGHWKRLAWVSRLPGRAVRQVISLPDGSQLINVYHAVLLKRADGRLQTVADTTQCSWYNTVAPYKGGALITGKNRLFFYDGKGLRPLHEEALKRQRIYNAATDREGRIWVSTNNDGILIFDGDGVLHFGLQEGLPHPLNIGFCEDREGNMWLGNFKGLIRLKRAYVEPVGSERHPGMNDVRAVFKSREGAVYFGHADSGFSYWDKRRLVNSASLLSKKEQAKFNKAIVVGFAQDNENRLWTITSRGGLFCFKNKKPEDLTGLPGLQAETFGAIQYNTMDSCLYVMSDDAIYKIKNNGLREKILINNGAAELQIIFFDRSHRLWAGTRAGDVGVYNLKTKRFHPVAFGFNPGVVVQLLEDGEGNMWMATAGKGVYRFRYGPEYRAVNVLSLSEKEGLKGDIVRSICLDKSGNLWAVCSNGLTRFDLSRKNAQGRYIHKNVGSEDGLTSRSFSDACLITDDSDDLWVGTTGGLFRLHTVKIPADSTTPGIALEAATVQNDSGGWEKYSQAFTSYARLPVNPVLPYNKNSITVYYNGIAFTHSDEVEYACRLDGLDTAWRGSTSVAYASFLNLSPAHYVFRVKARRKNYSWSGEEKFAFTVLPPFWETWWFRLFVIAAASSLLILAFRLRIRQIRRKAFLQQQMQELETRALKAQMNPHFLYNAMNSIQSLVMNDAPEQAVRYLGKFARLLRQVLDNSDRPLVTLQQDLASLRLYVELEALRLHKDFAYVLNVPDGLVQEDELVPPLLLQPYVENALWHGLSHKAGERKLLITVEAGETFLTCRIIDNGIGRTKATEIKSRTASALSKGLNITQRRLRLLNGDDVPPVVIEDLYDEAGVAAALR